MEIKVDPQDLSRARFMLAGIDNGLPKAWARALNTATIGLKDSMAGLLRDDYNFKIAAIKSRIKIDKAYPKKLTAAVNSTGKSIHLTDVLTTRPTLKGVTVNVKKSTGRKLLTNAFIREVNKKKIVFVRKRISAGRRVARLPVIALKASHPEVIYNTNENWAKLEKYAQERLDKAFAKEVDVVFRGIA